MKKGTNVCYYSDGRGRWVRREWKSQCPAKVFFYGRCQGVKGHKGVHWCYSPSGSLQWQDNAADPKHDGAAGSTPPGHKKYVAPEKMMEHYYMNHFTDAEVTDKRAIAMLEKDKTPESDAGINRPITDHRILAALKRRMAKPKRGRAKPVGK